MYSCGTSSASVFEKPGSQAAGQYRVLSAWHTTGVASEKRAGSQAESSGSASTV